MITEDGVLQIFPISGLITKYLNTFEEEFKFIQNLEYIRNGSNFRSGDTYVLRHKELSKINDFVHESLNKFTTEVLRTKQKVMVTQSWSNKNPPNTEHPAHHHPNSIISGVFYFKQNKTLPPIQFFRKHALPEFEFKIEEYNNMNSHTFLLPMIDGDLVLFPSTLWHGVPLNQGNDIRYSLSFNTFANELGSEEELTQLKIQEDGKER